MATTVDLGKVRPVWKGAWSANTAYEVHDMVKEGVDSYICTTGHTSGSTFSATNWDYLSQGAQIPNQSGNSGLVLKTDGTNLSWGDGGKIKAMDRFALTGLSSLSATSAETYFWTVTYNRQTNGDLWIVSDLPASELPNGPYVGPHLKIVCGSTTLRASRGLKWFRPNNDNTELGFNSYFTAAELGSYTGNITISHGWNWGGATSSVKPLSYINLGGTSGAGNNQVDSRVPNAGNTEGHMMVMEF